MRPAPDPAAEIGAGFLARAAAVVYWALVIEVLVVVTTAPALAAVVLLAGGEGNAPLIGLCFVPVAPALSAAVFAWRVFLTDRDLAPARHFRRGYRLNWLDVLRWWVPTLVALTVVGFTLANLDAAGVPAAHGLLLVLVALGILLWSAQALVLSSALSLRTRDLVRLAGHYLGARPAAALGTLSLLVAAAGIVVLTSDWVLVLLASPFTYLLLRTAEPVLRDATERFTG
ncbi:glycosyl transferase [Umezawaea endophytica]|uniref:Glycosyl transferase n=1 Tax=Umezawaea endophytica TaxID=1654476 RepID=A0A9X2VMF7_9PSEU|nr:glycosyl transferase [Umezawaea endophytica]MCS7479225.1 glycosyl transferase [Umezawaea endophytica]